MLFQMILRYSPFQSDDEDKIYDAILDSNQPSYPANMPDSARDLIQKLMRRDPQQRLGYRKGVEEIMSHAFFESMDWEALFEKRILPPFKPLIKGKDDVSNFAAEFTSKTPSLPTVHEGTCTSQHNMLMLTRMRCSFDSHDARVLQGLFVQ